RGVLQRWFSKRFWGGHVAMFAALVLTVLQNFDKYPRLWPWPEWQTWLPILAPSLFVLVMVVPYLFVCRWQLTPFPAALFGTSILFASLHSAWPSPVALFVLALALGWLAQRTQSLVGPTVMHALFNGIACLQLLMLGK